MMKVRSRILAAISVCLLYLNAGSVAMGGTLMPPGEQTFFDNNGLPLSSGCVFFYIPGTTSPKATYQNAAQTIANTNPVQLDAAGRAIIYGTGTYRQVVTAAGPNAGFPCSPSGAQIWDQITASSDSSATIFAGASSGTPNAITVNASAFSGTDGQVINYVSTNTNTGGATINPSGFGAVQIVRDSATGPGALIGGELVATNAVSLIYDATAGVFHILSPVTWPNTSGVPVGTVLDFPGYTAPTNYAFAYGQAVSRTTYAALMSALTLAQTGSISSGSPTITGLADTTQLGRGVVVEAVGIPNGTSVLSCTINSCTMSANATLTRSGTMTFFPNGNGDGSTTFNIPDFRGYGAIGNDSMGGVPGNIAQTSTTISTTSGSTAATVASGANIAIGMNVVSANVPSGTGILAISGTSVTLSAAATATASGTPVRFSMYRDAQVTGAIGGTIVKNLATAELPSHTHANSLTDPGHSHAFGQLVRLFGSAATGGTLVTAQFNATTDGSVTIASNTTGITINNAAAGSGQSFAYTQPNRIVNKIIKLAP